MGPYKPAEPLAQLIKQLEEGREFAGAGGQTISDAMMMSKVITLLAQTVIFNDDIREWRRQSADLKTWVKYKLFFHQAHREQKRAVTTARKGGTPQQYKTSIVNDRPLYKSTMKLSKTYKKLCRECKHKSTSWKDWHKPMQYLSAQTMC